MSIENKIHRQILLALSLGLVVSLSHGKNIDSFNEKVSLIGQSHYSFEDQYFFIQSENKIYKINRNLLDGSLREMFDSFIASPREISISFPQSSIESIWEIELGDKNNTKNDTNMDHLKSLTIISGGDSEVHKGYLIKDYSGNYRGFISENIIFNFKDFKSKTIGSSFSMTTEEIMHISRLSNEEDPDSEINREFFKIIKNVAIISGRRVYSFDSGIVLIQVDNQLIYIIHPSIQYFKNIAVDKYSHRINVSIPVSWVGYIWNINELNYTMDPVNRLPAYKE